MYDKLQSTRLNYERIYPDLCITKTGLQVTACPALAGAIASFKIGDYECIYALGHGAAMGWNTHLSPPGVTPPPPSGSELWDPTQHGQNRDDYRNLSGLPFDPTPTSPLFLPQMHGPSTSLIDPNTWKQGTDYFRSRTRMAYYIHTGWPSSYTPGLGAYPNPPHQDLSHCVIDNRVSFLPLGGWQVVQMDATLTIDPGEPVSPVLNSAMCAYLESGFTRFWRVLPNSSRVEVTAQAQTGFGSADPIIASTADGAYAFGVWAPASSGVNPFMFCQVDASPFQFQIVQVTYYHTGPVGPGAYPYRTYVSGGSLDWVHWLLSCARAL